MRLVDVPQPHADARRRKRALTRLRPLDERDRVVEVRLEIAPLGGGEALEAVEGEGGEDEGSGCVAVTDREGRARHRIGHAERAAGAADEGRLARAELAGD